MPATLEPKTRCCGKPPRQRCRRCPVALRGRTLHRAPAGAAMLHGELDARLRKASEKVHEAARKVAKLERRSARLEAKAARGRKSRHKKAAELAKKLRKAVRRLARAERKLHRLWVAAPARKPPRRVA